MSRVKKSAEEYITSRGSKRNAKLDREKKTRSRSTGLGRPRQSFFKDQTDGASAYNALPFALVKPLVGSLACTGA